MLVTSISQAPCGPYRAPEVSMGDSGHCRVGVLCRDVALQPANQGHHLRHGLPQQLRPVLLRPAPDLHKHAGHLCMALQELTLR